MSCTNDLTPIILAVAAIITIQVPLLITALINGLKTRSDAHKLKAVSYETRQKVDELTLITKNGFHGPPGPVGPPGPAGAGAPGAPPPPPPAAA